MPATIDDLLQGKSEPVTVRPTDLLEHALAHMFACEYSQLPVVNESNNVLAVITYESTVRALSTLRVTPHVVRVSDAMDRRVELCYRDDELLEVLDKLQRATAVLVVDRDKKLIGILTSYDTTEYFRRRTQSIMLAQDIEFTLRDFAQAAFRAEDDALDEDALTRAVEDISPSNKDLRGPFKKALVQYLIEQIDPDTKIKGAEADALFGTHLYRKDVPKSLDRLTLWHYIELLLHESRWPRFASIFSIERDSVKNLLNRVRDTRNDLAHLREVSQLQEDELKFCKDWLARHSDAVERLFARAPVPRPVGTADLQDHAATAGHPVSPIEEEANEESRFQALGYWLQTQPPTAELAAITFDGIEKMLQDKLPASAREHRSWWANTAVGHPQSKQWLEAGWRITHVSLNDGIVGFSRNKERATAYNEFFKSLSDSLARTGDFPAKQAVTSGQSWLTVAQLPTKERIAYLNFAFARSRRFRVELYIDTLSQMINKRVFDALWGQREAIEATFGEPLTWERLGHRRASRIAAYYQGSIEDTPADLEALRAKAVNGMVRLRTAITGPLGGLL